MEFLRNNKLFSFLYDNKSIWECDYTEKTEEFENKIIRTYVFDDGLRVTNIAKKNEKFGSYEWVNYFENTSDKPSGLISELWDCNVSIPMEREEKPQWKSVFPDAKDATKIYSPAGSTWDSKELTCDVDKIIQGERINHIFAGVTREYCSDTGRSNENRAPFFNVSKKGKGVIFAIGWTGKWRCSIIRESEAVIVKTKIDNTKFRLYGGEKIRTSSIVIMPYDCGYINSQNKWRRLVKDEYSLIGKEGRDSYAPLCGGFWGGMESDSIIDRVNRIAKNDIKYDCIWIDAGWYGIDTMPTPDEFEGDWPLHTGDWRISENIHPNGLCDVSKCVHENGMRLLLWFEPERVIKSTPIVKEHPEYFLGNQDADIRDENLLLNLGNKEAWSYCFRTLCDLIDKTGIDYYRQDFNFDPLPYWNQNDWNDRIGMTEIKHINGLYELWDALLERYPNLMIDNCASGGRRIDIETLRRSVPLWRSDFVCPANFDEDVPQCHNMAYNTWMPYSGGGSGRVYDLYRLRSSYAGALSFGFSFSRKEPFLESAEEIDFIKKASDEYLKIRKYFYADFYPLTEHTDNKDVWCAMQFDNPEDNDGMIEVFRRENSPYESSLFRLFGIDESKTYLFEDLDGGEFTISGTELAENGLKIEIENRRTAKIFIYKKLSQ